MELPKRKDIRLKEYDYSADGGYFITICTKDKKHILGTIRVGGGALDACKCTDSAVYINIEKIYK